MATGGLVNTEIEQQLGSPAGVDWDDFRVFVEVVRSGSFNRAAYRLKMTQPTVSRRLMRLEEAIGLRLFDRDRRGPRLTYDGQRIYNDACAAQSALARAASPASSARRRVEGECKLLMGDGVMSYWMPRFLPSFFARHPAIELKMFGALEPISDKREMFDLVVHYREPAEASLVAVRLGNLHFIPCASREYIRKRGMPKDVEALSKHRLLDISHYIADVGAWTNYLQDDDTHAMMYTNLSVCLAETVMQGAGIALLPTYVLSFLPDLVRLDIGVHFQIPMFVSYQRDAVKKWPVRLVLDYLRYNVFDRRNMPWFQDTYTPPAADWPQLLGELVEKAAILPVSEPPKLVHAV